MELRYLKTVVAIADHGGFAAAGAAIGLTQSAVSLHVKALEEELGTILFDRSKRPPVLSASGSIVVEQAREVLKMCARIRELAGSDDLSGSLSLGAVPTTLVGVLPRALAKLQKLQPKLNINLTTGLSGELARRIYKGDLDVATITEPIQLAAGLSWHPFNREPLVVIAPKCETPFSDRELLESRPFIRFKRFAWAGQLIDSRLRDRNIHVRAGMEIDSLEAIANMVVHGLGVSVVPIGGVAPSLIDQLSIVPFGKPTVHRVIGLIERASNPKSHLVKALHQVLIAESQAAGTLPEVVQP